MWIQNKNLKYYLTSILMSLLQIWNFQSRTDASWCDLIQSWFSIKILEFQRDSKDFRNGFLDSDWKEYQQIGRFYSRLGCWKWHRIKVCKKVLDEGEERKQSRIPFILSDFLFAWDLMNQATKVYGKSPKIIVWLQPISWTIPFT